MSNFEFLTVAQLEQQIDNNKRKNSHCLQSNLNAKSLQVISKKQKKEIPPRHKSFNFFQKLTGIDRRTIKRWVIDKMIGFRTFVIEEDSLLGV